MKKKCSRPRDPTTPPSQKEKPNNTKKILTQEDIQLPTISIPINVYKKLLKIASTMGIPAQVLGESAITRWVLIHGGHKND